ncbi:MAG: SRPBCC family protein [Myxococcota bacterium]
MDRTKEIRLIRAFLAQFGSGAQPLAGADSTIDVAKYLDAARYARECAVEFGSRLNLAAHSSELMAPGEFVTRDVLGAPVLIVRDDEQRARAFLNVCRHRGATVELRERGRCKRFVCPYHAWSYDRSGKLVMVRHPQGFPSMNLDEAGLVELACDESAGLIWVCPNPAVQPSLDEHARTLLAEIAGLGPEQPTLFARQSRVWQANWKILIDGALESYHFKIAHPKTVGPIFTDTSSTYERIGDHFRVVLPRTSMRSLSAVPESEWRLLEHANVLYILMPNAMVLAQDDHCALMTLNPIAVDATRIDVSTISRAPEGERHSERSEAFLRKNHEFTLRTLSEDFTLAEQIQRGLASGANSQFRLALFEGALRDFHAGLERRLTASRGG